MDELIAKEPYNGYFYELKGQILFENGDIELSIISYQKAADLLAKSPLIELEYVMALIESIERTDKNTEQRLNIAIKYLNKIVSKDTENAPAYRLLAKAYGKKNDIGMANYFLAEEALLIGKKDDAKRLAKFAKDKLNKTSPYYLKASDIIDLSP
jgi:predicted Zn-dependent protease